MNKYPITIQVLNPAQSQVLNKQGYRLAPVMSYNTEIWFQGRFKKERKTRRVVVIEKLSGKFPTGLLNRAVEYCKGFNIPLNVEYPKNERSIPKGYPYSWHLHRLPDRPNAF